MWSKYGIQIGPTNSSSAPWSPASCMKSFLAGYCSQRRSSPPKSLPLLIIHAAWLWHCLIIKLLLSKCLSWSYVWAQQEIVPWSLVMSATGKATMSGTPPHFLSTKCFTNIVLLNPHNNTVKLMLFSPFCRWENWVSESLHTFLRVSPTVNDGIGLQSLSFPHHTMLSLFLIITPSLTQSVHGKCLAQNRFLGNIFIDRINGKHANLTHSSLK